MYQVKIKKIKIFFLIVCLAQLFYLFQFRSGFKYEIIKNPFKEISGVSYAVSAEVIESKNIIKKNKVNDFNLSKNLKKETYFYQRFIEFNYPIRISDSSKYTFFLIDENVTNACKIIESGKYLKLSKC